MNNDIKPLKNEFTFNIKEKSYDNKLYLVGCNYGH